MGWATEHLLPSAAATAAALSSWKATPPGFLHMDGVAAGTGFSTTRRDRQASHLRDSGPPRSETSVRNANQFGSCCACSRTGPPCLPVPSGSLALAGGNGMKILHPQQVRLPASRVACEGADVRGRRIVRQAHACPGAGAQRAHRPRGCGFDPLGCEHNQPETGRQRDCGGNNQLARTSRRKVSPARNRVECGRS
jgi:hypothetical protein